MTYEWLAGFFDGEGCISGRSFFQKGKYISNPRVFIQVSITQKDRRVLELIQANFGGSIHDKKRRCSHIRWTNKTDMRNILLGIAPYSICKKPQIILALKFLETVREENLGCVAMPPEIHAERKEIYEQLKVLKVV